MLRVDRSPHDEATDARVPEHGHPGEEAVPRAPVNQQMDRVLKVIQRLPWIIVGTPEDQIRADRSGEAEDRQT